MLVPSDLPVRNASPTTTLRLEISSGPWFSTVQMIVAIWDAYKEYKVCMCSEGELPNNLVN